MIPAIADDKLPASSASVCSRCFFDRGRLEACREPEIIRTIASAQDVISVHRTSSGAWQWWNEIAHVCQSPVTDNDHYLLTMASSSPRQFTHAEAVSRTPRPLGLPAPSTAPDIEISGSGNGTIACTVSYVYTLVTDQGEESASSLPTAVVDIEEGQSVILSGLVSEAPSSSHVVTLRIYRLQGSEYLYVNEISVSKKQFIDADPASELSGALLETETWTPPPANLRGLVSFGQGTYAGFVNKDVYISETFIPYAYPTGYSRSVNAPVVGLAPVSGGMIVLTTDKPVLFQGIDPATVLQQELDVEMACVSARSIASSDAGVVFATERGIAFVSASGQPSLLTQKTYTEKQWAALFPTPSLIIGMTYHGEYLFCAQGTSTVYALDLSDGSVVLHPMSGRVTCMWYDGHTSKGYVVTRSGGTSTVWSWRTGGQGEYSWTSREFYFPAGVTPTCARIASDFSQGSIDMSIDAGSGSYLPTTRIESDIPFRLPPGTTHRLKLTVSGSSPISSVTVSGSISELRGT
jgi:hypothetical protein